MAGEIVSHLEAFYSCQVRFAALITVLALAEKLRENYIVLLPESIPFLAELMEGKSQTLYTGLDVGSSPASSLEFR